MSPKTRQVLGTITIGLIVGGTIYAIIKSKQAEKEAESAISLSEAREMMAERKRKESPDSGWGESYTPTNDEVRDFKTRPIQAIKVTDDIEEDDDEEELTDEEEAIRDLDRDEMIEDKYANINEFTPGPSIEPLEDFMYFEEGINPKEDKVLRHDPNSVEAKHQYIRMELAGWEPNHPIYRIMLQLFEFNFIPTNDGDEILRTQIIDHKVQFFGFESRWVKEVSFADVVFHYARNTEFNCGESVEYWVEYFMDFTEFEWDAPVEHFEAIVLRIVSHTYFNEERHTFGLFGLTHEGITQAIRIANGNIDRSVTFEIEFNEFLKSFV